MEALLARRRALLSARLLTRSPRTLAHILEGFGFKKVYALVRMGDDRVWAKEHQVSALRF